MKSVTSRPHSRTARTRSNLSALTIWTRPARNYEKRQRTASCSFNVEVQPPPRLGLTRFVAFGDSITLGEDGNSTLAVYSLRHFLGLDYPTIILTGREYPTVLRNLLSVRYSTQSPLVVIAGKSGEHAGDSTTLTRFTDIVASRTYEVVLLMEGTNDI